MVEGAGLTRFRLPDKTRVKARIVGFAQIHPDPSQQPTDRVDIGHRVYQGTERQRDFPKNFGRCAANGSAGLSVDGAFATDPTSLLLNEPLGALDAMTKLTMQEELARIWREEKGTMILVTHDLEEAIYLADRVLVLPKETGAVPRLIDVNPPRPRDRSGPPGCCDAAATDGGVWFALGPRNRRPFSSALRFFADPRSGGCPRVRLLFQSGLSDKRQKAWTWP
jgi:hypothetical protein